MVERSRLTAVTVVVGCLVLIAAGCGSESAQSLAAPSPVFSAGVIEIEPDGAIVGTYVNLESRLVADPSAGALSYTWDFGDGTIVSGGAAMTHVYAQPGVYVATLTVTSSEAGSSQATLNLPVRSISGRWFGDLGVVSITQDGLDVRGTYQNGALQGVVGGKISEAGIVTFTVTSPGQAPVTFTGTAGPDVFSLIGAANGRDLNRLWTLIRD